MKLDGEPRRPDPEVKCLLPYFLTLDMAAESRLNRWELRWAWKWDPAMDARDIRTVCDDYFDAVKAIAKEWQAAQRQGAKVSVAERVWNATVPFDELADRHLVAETNINGTLDSRLRQRYAVPVWRDVAFADELNRVATDYEGGAGKNGNESDDDEQR